MSVEHSKAPRVDSQRSGAAHKTNAKPSNESGGSRLGSSAGFAEALATAAMDESTASEARPSLESAMQQEKPEKGQLRNASSRSSTVAAQPMPNKEIREDALTKADERKARRKEGADVETPAGSLDGSSGLPQAPALQLPLTGPINDAEGAMSASEGASADAKGKLASIASGKPGLVSTLKLQQQLYSGGVRGTLKANEAVANDKDGSGDAMLTDSSSVANSRLEMVMNALGKPASPNQVESIKPASMMQLVGSLASDHSFNLSARERDTTTTVYGAPTLDQAKSEGSLDGGVDYAGAADAEELIASDTVRFWMGSEQTQQADMTVVDVGGGSVDVSIRLQGKEAHVVFRAEESTARDALQAEGGQLKELLSQGGLTLSGMSVGTSAGESSQNRGRQSAEQAPNGVSKLIRVDVGSVAGSKNTGGGLGGAPSSGRGIDFYV